MSLAMSSWNDCRARHVTFPVDEESLQSRIPSGYTANTLGTSILTRLQIMSCASWTLNGTLAGPATWALLAFDIEDPRGNSSLLALAAFTDTSQATQLWEGLGVPTATGTFVESPMPTGAQWTFSTSALEWRAMLSPLQEVEPDLTPMSNQTLVVNVDGSAIVRPYAVQANVGATQNQGPATLEAVGGNLADIAPGTVHGGHVVPLAITWMMAF